MSFNITDISSEKKFDLNTSSFRDLNKRFGRREDYLELKVHTLNDELLSTIKIASRYYKVINRDKDGLSNEIKVDFDSLLRDNGFNVGKFKLKLCVYRLKIFNNTPFNIKEISNSRREIRAIVNGINNRSFDRAINSYVAERDASLYFKDFLIKFPNTESIGINLLLNNLTPKHEILIKTYEPLPTSISLKDTFTVIEEIINPLFLIVDLSLNLTGLENSTENIFLQPNFNIDTRNNNSIPSSYKDFNNILNYSLTSSYQNLLNQLENRDVPEISYDYIRPISSSTENIDTPSHFENFVHFGSATERLHNFKYKLSLIELYDNQITNINSITGNASASSFTLTNKEDINTRKTNVIKNFDGYEKFLYFTEGTNNYTWPKLTTTYPFQLYSTTSSQAINWLGEEGYGNSIASGQLNSASIYDANNEYNLEKLIPNHIVENNENNFYLSFVNMIGQHFDHIWTHIKHITEIKDTHHTRGVSKDLVWYQLKALGIDAFDQFENSNLIEYILGQGTAGSQFYDTPANQTLITASNDGSIAKQDITKEVWKRLYHNAPYLLKTKGTERGIRALMSCYGLPSTILNVKEYGGSTPYTDLLKDVDLNSQYKTFTYQKSSLALQSISSIDAGDYMVRFPWEDNDIAGRTSKAIELRIKPIKGNEGVALSLGNTTIDASGLQLTLDKYEGSDISSSNDVTTYGRIQLKQGANLRASTSYFPLYNGDFWNLHLMGTGADVNFGAYQTNHLKNTFKFTGTWGSNNFANTFGANSGAGRTYVYGGVDGYNGSIQELKCNWGEELTDTTLTKHSFEPFMYAGNNISSSFSNVIIRLPLGSTDVETLENHPPDISLKHANTSADTTGGTLYEEIVEDHHLPTPDTVGRSMSSEKVRIDTGTIDDDILLPYAKGETSTLDRQPQDFSDLGIHFSPTMEINEDILYTLGSFRLDDYIGSPLPSAQSSSQYLDLKEIKDYYFKKVHRRYNYWDYIKLIQHVDHTLFKIIENWVPWKANTKTGLLIEPHYLERNKFQRTMPARSDGQTMTTGLHGIINAKVVGEQLNELYKLTNSSVITTNNLSSTLTKEQRTEQGTNANINIFDNYTNPFLRDANDENNQSSQAPITPFIPGAKPNTYIAHNSNILLGNATKGKTSSRYYRTLRNGKEIDF
tara:strand:+ start:9480 stop:12941 length:3462 start_codon:yes stop_codon:yes gene_type:complete